MIVLGSHGAGGFARLVMGSVSSQGRAARALPGFSSSRPRTVTRVRSPRGWTSDGFTVFHLCPAPGRYPRATPPPAMAVIPARPALSNISLGAGQDQYVGGAYGIARNGLLLSQLAQVGVGGLRGLDADPGVNGHGTLTAGDDGTQVQFGDLREVVGHLGDPQQHVLQ
jgi:hypothetical protein